MNSYQKLQKYISYDSEGVLNIESLPIPSLINGTIGTPFYCYTSRGITENFELYREHFPKASICYAVKANSNLTILKMLVDLGAGLDVVSGGELMKAIKVGAKTIIFSGVGKNREELKLAVESKIYQINIESLQELLLLQEIVGKNSSYRPKIAIRINPAIDSGTNNDLITTGRRKDKFGILEEDLDEVFAVINKDCVDLVGLSVHIGSSMLDIGPIKKVCSYIKGLANRLAQEGCLNLRTIDLGGGVGIRYHGNETLISMREYAKLATELAASLECELIIEPGRSIVGDSGLLVTSVEYVKYACDEKFVIVDAGMNDFMRKAIYPDAFHGILPVLSSENCLRASVVGPICESSDVFVKDIDLPANIKRGDALVICSAGAYGFSMANNYNSRCLPAEIMVKGRDYSIIRSRQTYNELWSAEL